MILFEPLNKINALKYIGYVIYPSFLHIQYPHGIIQIKLLILCGHEQINKLFGELHEAILLSLALLTRGVINQTCVI